MFGDKLIIGNSNIKLDAKHRFTVPNFTKVETGEKLIIAHEDCNHEFALRLYSYKQYLKIIERYKKLSENANSLEDYI